MLQVTRTASGGIETRCVGSGAVGQILLGVSVVTHRADDSPRMPPPCGEIFRELWRCAAVEGDWVRRGGV